MEFKIKIGDKCKIPKTKSVGESIEESFTMQKAKKLNQDFLFYVGKSKQSQNHMLYFEQNSESGDYFAEHEIELYEEKQETMKNLLETEFVIENCTLSQRLAIKAYCDEKKITYVDLEVPSYKTLTFSDGKFKGFINSVVQRNKITFSELIQFLDKYQPEPEFKVGDFVYFEGKYHQAGPYLLKEKISDGAFEDSNNETRDIKESRGAYRHATPEEIKKWKEENETKLPRIADEVGIYNSKNKTLRWGCTEISISTVKELLELKLTHINFDDGREADYKQIQQIKKFIEHNKL